MPHTAGRHGMTLWYTRPAEQWVEALPIGNGRLGAMIFGGIAHERLALNEDTLWSGAPRPWNNPHARELLPEVRRRVASGDYAGADRIARQMQGPYGESFQPLGDLLLEFPDQPVAGYRRELDLHTALAAVRYHSGKTMFSREAFASAPDRVVVVRLTADLPAQISLTARLATPHPHRLESYDECTVLLYGTAPTHVAPDYLHVEQPVRYEAGGAALTFTAGLRIVAEGGRVTGDGTAVHVQDADAITLLVAAATSFQGSTHNTGTSIDPAAQVAADLAQAAGHQYATLRTAHIEDHAALFDRVSLDLGYTEAATRPTDERIRAWTETGDPHLAALLFQYGRYLLIASSRPGTQPATLQGIWNDQVRPPWSSNWTLNINTQMNYWLAEPANLAECHVPLFDLVSDLSRTGKETAETNYGCPGWVAHHNTDLWRQSAPVGDYGHGDPVWALWPMAGAWLCRHLWEQYQFSGDIQFLRERAYPIMRGAAEFCLEWLLEDAHGFLITAPSTSPENMFTTPDGRTAAVSAASTMDMAIIQDLFTNCIEAAALLEEDSTFRETLAAARDRLRPPRIGRLGQLQEWSEDWDSPDDRHRHLSHLFGLYPGRQISPHRTPGLARAARRSLELRGESGTGWSTAWKVNLWARLLEGDRAYRQLSLLLTPAEQHTVHYHGEGSGLYSNLFAAHPPFQIDANFGFTAGVAEMVLQSHEDVLHLLPALPAAWPAGQVTGLRARGGFTVEITWENGTLHSAGIEAARSGLCRVRSALPVIISLAGIPVPVERTEDGIVEFIAAAGGRYRIACQTAMGKDPGP